MLSLPHNQVLMRLLYQIMVAGSLMGLIARLRFCLKLLRPLAKILKFGWMAAFAQAKISSKPKHWARKARLLGAHFCMDLALMARRAFRKLWRSCIQNLIRQWRFVVTAISITSQEISSGTAHFKSPLNKKPSYNLEGFFNISLPADRVRHLAAQLAGLDFSKPQIRLVSARYSQHPYLLRYALPSLTAHRRRNRK